MSKGKPPVPSLRALLAFRAAARHHRLVDAAGSLGVTESAVSHQIRQLEDLLHLTLFDRTSRNLTLTAAGQRYLARIEPALREIEAATAAMMPAEGRAAVSLTLPPSLAVTWLIPRLGRFDASHPRIDVQLVSTTRLVDLARDQIDLAIRYGRGDWPGTEAVHLFDDLVTPVVAPGFAMPEPDRPSALPGGIRYLVNRSIPSEWEEWAKARGLAPPALEDALVLDSIEQVLELAEGGHGVAMGRSPYIKQRLARGTLVAPFGAAGPSGAGYFLCQAAGTTPTSAARSLARWLRQEAGSEAASADAET